jgi:hypothetical protein
LKRNYKIASGYLGDNLKKEGSNEVSYPIKVPNIVESLLKWLSDMQHEVTFNELVGYVTEEVTGLGVTQRTIRSYIAELHKQGLIDFKENPLRCKITDAGLKFLERYGV